MTINTAEKKKFPDPKSPDNPAAAGVYPPFGAGTWEAGSGTIPPNESQFGRVRRTWRRRRRNPLSSFRGSFGSFGRSDDDGDDDGDDVIAANNETPDYQSHFFHACAHSTQGTFYRTKFSIINQANSVEPPAKFVG